MASKVKALAWDRETRGGGCGKGEQVKPLCPARQNQNERLLYRAKWL